jgi:DUF2894 family protein
MSDVRATLERWRDAGADRIDPLRFATIEALARRIAERPLDGEFQCALDARLAALIAGYERDIKRKRESGPIRFERPASQTEHSARGTSLAALTASLSRRDDRTDTLADTLRYFDTVWSKLSAGRQLRQSFAQVPGNAGPLNSSRLVHRALSLMNELSPEYLQNFLSYVETLSALGEPGAGTQPSSAESASHGKSAKGVKQPLRRKPKGS